MKSDKNIKKPWPTKEAMTQVYEKHLWGSNNSQFYSGEGSHKPKIVKPYVKAVTSFLKSFNEPLIVCDLGCGDFNVGKQLAKHTKHYVAVDIVENLITHNMKIFKAKNLEFQCLDIAKDELPTGDCAILRQVLQHLSNTEVQTILNKLSDYKYVIITEHSPYGNFKPNKDIISGQGTRLKKKSGIDVLAEPFQFKVKAKKKLLRIVLGNGVIETIIYHV